MYAGRKDGGVNDKIDTVLRGALIVIIVLAFIAVGIFIGVTICA